VGALINLVGQRFGRLLVIERAENSPRGDSRWRCRCDCGNESFPWGKSLIAKTTSSCGCRKGYGGSWKSHGMSGTRVYRAWQAMKKRITSRTNKRHIRDYQQRGITICPQWFRSFEAFYTDLGDPPSPAHSLDRIDNDGNYEPGNVRWATRSEQQHNKRKYRKKAHGI
jgi:hypothetical protein